MILITLVHNLSFLIALSIVSGFLDKRIPRTTLKGLFVQGLLFGIVAIVGMMQPLVFSKGLIFDGRSVVISLATLFFGPIPGSIAGIMSIIFRVYQGGPGIVPGILVVISSVTIGAVFHVLRKKTNKEVTVRQLIFLGLAVHIAMLLMMFSLPFPMAISVIQRIGIPVILTYPLATVLIGKILSDQEVNARYIKNLKASEMKFHSFFENSMDAMLLTIPDGDIIEANQAACRMFGYTEEEFIKLGRNGIVDLADPKLPVLLSERASNGKVMGELTFIRKDGNHFTAEISSAIFKNWKSHEHTNMIIRDITERKQTERHTEALYGISQAIYSTENIDELYQHIHNNLSNIIPARNFFIALLTNDEKKLYLPYNRDEKDSNKIWIIDADDPQSLIVEVIRSKRPLLLNEKKLQDRYSSGKNRVWGTQPKCWLGVPLMIREKAIGIIAVQNYYGKDVYSQKDVALFETAARQIAIAIERKRAEEEIAMLAHSLRSINECVSITDLENKIIFVNQSFSKTYGYKENELIGKHINIVRSSNDPKELEREILPNTLLDGWQGELWNTRKDGSEFQIYLSTTTIKDKNGKPLGLIGIAADITERKRAEKELIIAKEKAEEMNRLKTNFLANMSHELRTPLVGILGYANFLESELKDEELVRMAETIKISGQRLNETLNNILDISKIESETQQANLIKQDLLKLLIEQVKLFKVLADSKGISLSIETTEEILNAYIDEKMFISVIDNLLNNGIKFTEKGGVTIIVKREDNKVVIEVKDTGIGVSKELQEIIFEPFRQASEGYGRNFEGTGLGLTLVKKYTDLMGGTITVKSEPGEGTVFILKLNGIV